MNKINSNSFFIGIKIIVNKVPFCVLSNEFIKPGKGQSFNRVKMKNLISNKIMEKTLRPNDYFEVADIREVNMQFLYKNNNTYFFIDNSNYEQYDVGSKVVLENKKWLKEKCDYLVTLWNNNIILISPPNFITLKVIDTSPDTKNDSLSGSKLAKLETGALIRVPFFIKNEEFVKINTKLSQYISRVKRF